MHPNIVSVYEYAEDEVNAFIAMEYVEGTGLREYLNRKASFDLGQIVAIVSQLLLALDFAHERGVVHRDVKPANLILTSEGALKVADFGIARIDTSNLTNAGMVMGTPSYMSPEQCQGKEVDRRSDLFSTGVVLYELLTGEKPFAGSIEAIAFKICYEDPRPPSEISKLDISPALDAIVTTALGQGSGHAVPEHQSLQPCAAACARSRDQHQARGAGRDGDQSRRCQVAGSGGPVWDDTTLHTIERQLANFVGPMARVWSRRQRRNPGTRRSSTHCCRKASPIQQCARSSLPEWPVPPPRAPPRTNAAAERGGRCHRSCARSAAERKRLAPLDPDFVEQTTSRLAVYLGPIAKVVTRRAAQRPPTGKNSSSASPVILGPRSAARSCASSGSSSSSERVLSRRQPPLQDRFDARRLADRIEQRLVTDRIGDEDKAFIESLDMFFLATADADNQPSCSYKGGEPGFVRVVDPATLAFPSYDGNGMFLSMGNVATNRRVGMLVHRFPATEAAAGLGRSVAAFRRPAASAYPEAQFIVRVAVTRVFPNCPRYIHKFALVERSSFVPQAGCATPVPNWKKSDWAKDVLPEGDSARGK